MSRTLIVRSGLAALLCSGSLAGCAAQPASTSTSTSASTAVDGARDDRTSARVVERRSEPSLNDIVAGFSPAVRADIATLRAATAPYHDLKAAQAAGYPATVPACVADSTMGGMGRHYFDRTIYDDTLDIARPEMLIYAPGRAGAPDQLVAVEYVIPFRLLPATARPPRLFGQELRRHEEFKYWYLHVWAWRKNSAGLFADWDPSIACN
ncbi:MAG: hypothetical protein ACO1Q7_18825 [Gemmatimonas sp.]